MPLTRSELLINKKNRDAQKVEAPGNTGAPKILTNYPLDNPNRHSHKWTKAVPTIALGRRTAIHPTQ